MKALKTGVLVIVPYLAANTASAQMTVVVRDISPDQSSSDAANPNGASGGRVNGLGVDRTTPARVFAASEWGGLFRSLDNGLTWAHLDGHVPTTTWDVEVDPTNSNRVYATSFYDGRVNSRAGINVSTDGGATWTRPATATPPAGFCLSDVRRPEPAAFGISIDPANAKRVFIGTNCGLAVSADAGVTWNFVDPTPANGAQTVWDVVVHHGGIIDICGDDRHRRSTDGGATWTTATGTPLQPLPSGRCSLTVSPDEAYVLFAVVRHYYLRVRQRRTDLAEQLRRTRRARAHSIRGDQSARGRHVRSVVRRRQPAPRRPAPRPARQTPAGRSDATRPPRGPTRHRRSQRLGRHRLCAWRRERCLSHSLLVRRRRLSQPQQGESRLPHPGLGAAQRNARMRCGIHLAGGSRRPGATPEDLYFGNQDTGTFGTTNAGGAARDLDQ